MNPISRVKPDARIRRQTDTMQRHPELAALVADCIAAHAEIELNLGKALAAILRADTRTAMAMYIDVENRAAQGRMIRSAIKAADIPQEHKDLFNALLSALAAPAMKERDRLAHWCWGWSPDIADALLIFEPSGELENEVARLEGDELATFDIRHGYVVTKPDLERTLDRLRTTDRYLRMLHWVLRPPMKNLEELSDELYQKLSKAPQVEEALSRIREQRKNAQAEQQQSPPEDGKGEAK